jgi:hypothetical protein
MWCSVVCPYPPSTQGKGEEEEKKKRKRKRREELEIIIFFPLRFSALLPYASTRWGGRAVEAPAA